MNSDSFPMTSYSLTPAVEDCDQPHTGQCSAWHGELSRFTKQLITRFTLLLFTMFVLLLHSHVTFWKQQKHLPWFFHGCILSFWGKGCARNLHRAIKNYTPYLYFTERWRPTCYVMRPPWLLEKQGLKISAVSVSQEIPFIQTGNDINVIEVENMAVASQEESSAA